MAQLADLAGEARRGLEGLGSEALVKSLSDTNFSIREAATNALAEIAPETLEWAGRR